MPVTTGKDTQGCFARWGKTGKKYHYRCGSAMGRKRAKKKASQQGQAIFSSGYRG